MLDDMTLLNAARQVRENAYAPYSDFLVGVAIEDETGALHVGCNVENAAFPNGVCAEAGAIGALVASGAKTIVKIAIIGGPRGATDFTACVPCGGCRQRIAELATPDTQIILADSKGQLEHYSVDDLLPKGFSF